LQLYCNNKVYRRPHQSIILWSPAAVAVAVTSTLVAVAQVDLRRLQVLALVHLSL
jgi:hypothetical protein